MTSEELKDCMLAGSPVEHFGIRYKRISGIILRVRNGHFFVSAELEDRSGNSLTIAHGAHVKRAEENCENDT